MKRYIGHYSENEQWIAFGIMAPDIYDAQNWIKSNIQEYGICVSLLMDEIYLKAA